MLCVSLLPETPEHLQELLREAAARARALGIPPASPDDRKAALEGRAAAEAHREESGAPLAWLAEIRLDRFADPGAVARAMEAAREVARGAARGSSGAAAPEPVLPLVVSCRRAGQGGFFEGTESARRALLEAALPHAWLVDVEVKAEEVARGIPRERRLLSLHQFGWTPTVLPRLLREMESRGAAAVKIATQIESPADNLRLLALYALARGPLLAHGMGRQSAASRMGSLWLGAPYAYVALARDRETAPGQLTLAEAARAHPGWAARVAPEAAGARPGRARELRFFGILGDPVHQSLSPAIHNAAYRAAGIDAACLPFPCHAGELAGLVAAAGGWSASGGSRGRAAVWGGFAVTHPLKAEAAAASGGPERRAAARSHASAAQALAHRVGAANTLVAPRASRVWRLLRWWGPCGGWGPHGHWVSRAARGLQGVAQRAGAPGRWTAANTDGPAIAAVVGQACARGAAGPPSPSRFLEGLRVHIVGAGGTGLAAAASLSAAGAEVLLVGRDASRTAKAAYRAGVEFAALPSGAGDPPAAPPDVVVQATPVGMNAPEEVAPVPPAWLVPGMVVVDLVYRPVRTGLLRAAREKGCRCVDGLAIFLEQARRQMRLLTGVDPDPGILRAAALRALREDGENPPEDAGLVEAAAGRGGDGRA